MNQKKDLKRGYRVTRTQGGSALSGCRSPPSKRLSSTCAHEYLSHSSVRSMRR